MELTDEEKKLFKRFDERLLNTVSNYCEPYLIYSYRLNNEDVRITYGYIKRILVEVAKKRGLDIDVDETFDINNLLKQIADIPEEMADFDPVYFRNIEKLNKYVDDKTKNMSSKEMESFLDLFTGCNRITEFMAGYIQKLMLKIDELEFETREESILDNDVWVGYDFINSETHKKEQVDWSAFEGVDWENSEFEKGFCMQESAQDNVEEKVTDEELINIIRYINSFPQLHECIYNVTVANKRLAELADQKKLNEFYSNKSFVEDFKKIMAHDIQKHIYHFHGTQCLDSANTIMSEGLGMMRDSLSTTSYPEFTMDQVILYKRGFGGEIGRDAIIIIDQPIQDDGRPKEIVERLSNDKKIHFSPSGLQGIGGSPKYIIDSRYIVGYVDKKNKAIIYNPRYYDYNKFNIKVIENKPNGVPYDNNRIAEGVLNANVGEILIQKEQDDLQQ